MRFFLRACTQRLENDFLCEISVCVCVCVFQWLRILLGWFVYGFSLGGTRYIRSLVVNVRGFFFPLISFHIRVWYIFVRISKLMSSFGRNFLIIRCVIKPVISFLRRVDIYLPMKSTKAFLLVLVFRIIRMYRVFRKSYSSNGVSLQYDD